MEKSPVRSETFPFPSLQERCEESRGRRADHSGFGEGWVQPTTILSTYWPRSASGFVFVAGYLRAVAALVPGSPFTRSSCPRFRRFSRVLKPSVSSPPPLRIAGPTRSFLDRCHCAGVWDSEAGRFLAQPLLVQSAGPRSHPSHSPRAALAALTQS